MINILIKYFDIQNCKLYKLKIEHKIIKFVLNNTTAAHSC